MLPPAVVLCGGLGTRLRTVVSDRPKVLAEVGGVPFLTLLLRHLQGAGVARVILSAGYRADQIEAYVRTDAPGRLTVEVVAEPEPLGTGGALRLAAHAAGLRTPFLALNGDTFCDADLAALVAAHKARPDALATLALVRVPDAARYGTVAFDPDTHRVAAFAEKQPGRAAWVNAGVYVLDPAVF
ncbi:MAG TPA: sugar phosphate nucleotidyltransferase, partial [Rhodothermales bacterium]|nr:sugar phosphate nucleotidyltransferase [Rhodothermales bacterium]